MADNPETQVVLILVGLVASGKSTFAQALETFFPLFRRCNQDDLGNRRKVEALAVQTLRQGLSVCIDRTNFDESQRGHFINIARSFPNTTIWALIFDTPYEVCASRLQTRTNHPTITNPELGLSILERFSADYRPPIVEEGFDRIMRLRPHPTGKYTRDEVAAILADIRNSKPPPPRTPDTNRQFFRGSYSGDSYLRDSSHQAAASWSTP
ncbi:P-loop containing nucleoside triphosphate hydrolase protein [Gautieria morchelliformis]|nr:P-loop containing nucleoside triphosphate hydrolase protein [Gautieria morchelliformis]